MSKFQSYKNIDESYKAPGTMMAAVLSGTGYKNFKIREVPVPEPGPNQLLARVDATTLCVSMNKAINLGADHSYFYGWNPERNPVILGDEGSITIVKVGNKLKGEYKVGQRYTIQPPIRCAPINYKENYRDIGKGIDRLAVGYTLGGHYAQYILILEEVIYNSGLVQLPNQDMPYFAVSLGEPMSTIVRAHQLHIREYQSTPSSKRKLIVGLKKGGTTVIIGQGPMGRLHDEFALRSGIKNLIMVEIDSSRLNWAKNNLDSKAKKKGIVTYYLNPKVVDVELKVREITQGNMADDIIIPVGNARVQEDAIKLAGRGCRVNLFGGTKGATIQVDPAFFHYYEGVIVGSSGAETYDMKLALEAISNGDINPGLHTALIGRFKNIPELLERAVKQEFDGKVVIYPHIELSEPIETSSSWDAKKEEMLFEKLL